MRAVHVEPEAVLPAEGADRLEVVVEAGPGRACGGHHRDRPPAGGAGALERLRQALRPDPLQLVGVHRHERVRPEPRDAHAARHRVVRGGWRQHGEVAGHPRGPGVGRRPGAGGEHRGEVGQRAAVGEHAAAPCGIPADLLHHPLDDRLLDRQRPRAHLLDRHGVVDRAVDEVGQHAGHVRSRHLVGERARVVEAGRELEVARQEVAELLGVHAALAQAAAQVERPFDIGERRPAHRWALAALARGRVLAEPAQRGLRSSLEFLPVPHAPHVTQRVPTGNSWRVRVDR